jgi:hypothetical protein
LSRVLFRPAAAAELDEAHRWYERERAGLGDEFLEAAQALVARLAENPLASLWFIATGAGADSLDAGPAVRDPVSPSR